jgi:2-polyprenyl-3-methyl-5-hydroxy-6-metoxy-1,4-benzoquinol methylase
MALGVPLDRRSRAVAEERWVRETGLGSWFLGTDIWVQYVLQPALTELSRLLGARSGPRRRILDVGCGHGKALPLLDAMFTPEVLMAVDIDAAAITRAAREAHGCRCRVELAIEPVTRLAAPSACFDLVFCHQTVHHVLDPGER